MTRFAFFLGALLLVACQQSVLYSDNFENQSVDWFTESDPFGRTLIDGGKLYIELLQGRAIQYSTLRQPLLDNFDVQVDATLVSGDPNYSGYGILMRHQPNGTYYRFGITAHGYFAVQRYDGAGSWRSLTGRWQRADAINVGENATNRLRVAANGPIVVFSVNDQVLWRTDQFDASYGMGNIALSASTFSQSPVRVAFDDLVIREP